MRTNSESVFPAILPRTLRLTRARVLAILLAGHAPPTAQALNATWNGGSDALWATPANWSASTVPGAGDTATFDNAGGAVDVISLAGVTIHTILFDTANAAAYTLGSGAAGGQTLALANGGGIILNPTTVNNQLCNAAVVLGTDGSTQGFTFSNNSTAATLTFAATVGGSAGAGTKALAVAGSGSIALTGVVANGTGGTTGLTKSGTGTLAVSNTSNTFSGGTVISAGSGTVTATTTNGTNRSGLGTGAVSIGAGSTLNLLSANPVNTATTLTNGFTGTGTLKVTFSETAAASYTVLGGVGGFSGTIRLANTTSANKDKWYANNIGNLNAALIIDSASQIFVSGGPAAFAGIRVSGTGNAEGYGAIRLGNTLGGEITLDGNTTIGLGGGTITGNIRSGAPGTQTLTLGTTSAATTGTFSGTIGGGTGALALTQVSGTSTLTAPNIHTGPTLVGGGTLKLGHNLALQNSPLDTTGTGTLAFGAGINAPVIGGLTGATNLTLPSNVTALTLNPLNSVTASYSGRLGNATAGMSLTKTGFGTQVLAGANTFTGPTVISQGTLRISTSPTLSLPAGLKIMPLGDSITHGGGSDSNYRFHLNRLLAPVAPGFQFVGESTENAGTLPTSPIDQRHHCGHSSYSCNDINNNLDGLDTATFNLYGGAARDPHGGYWFTGGNGTGRAPIYPDAILLLVAANDISRVGMTGVKGRLEALLTKITTLRPAARVFLAKSSPYSGYDASVATFNAIVATVAADFQAAGRNITVVDLNTGYPAGQFVDAVHPNATGYNWMANRWFDALVDVYGTYATATSSPALATTSSVTVAMPARLEGNGKIGGPLTVAGIAAPGTGASTGTFSAGATTVSGLYACDLTPTASDQLAATGDLTLSNAILAITVQGVPAAASYVIASYSGALHGAFATVTGLPAGYVVYHDEAARRILLATHYEAWRLANSVADASRAMDRDPDGDGVTNLMEFALGGNPQNPGDHGISLGAMQEADGERGMTLTLAARTGAAFGPAANQSMTATIDGAIYQIEASQDLAAWTAGVTELIPARTTGLPPVPAGYEYHTFRATAPVSAAPRAFLRLRVSAIP